MCWLRNKKISFNYGYALFSKGTCKLSNVILVGAQQLYSTKVTEVVFLHQPGLEKKHSSARIYECLRLQGK